jgi:hypothetical protein
MSPTSWHCSDANEDGFVSFEVLRKRAAASTEEEFVRDFPVPALLVLHRGEDFSVQGREQLYDPNDRGFQLLTMTVPSSGILRYLGKVAFLAKRPGNPFAHLVSIGRSASNDITVAVDSISRVHGYCVAGDAAGGGRKWSFSDHGSTNGSRLDDRDVISGQSYGLRDGTVLQLGFEAVLELLMPESLHRRALK